MKRLKVIFMHIILGGHYYNYGKPIRKLSMLHYVYKCEICGKEKVKDIL